jgi:hypothetical protein
MLEIIYPQLHGNTYRSKSSSDLPILRPDRPPAHNGRFCNNPAPLSEPEAGLRGRPRAQDIGRIPKERKLNVFL